MVRIQAGDLTAFEQLVARFENMVFGLARSIVGTREDAEEASQDAFLKLFRARDRFDADRPIEPWLLRITGNTCRDLLRRRRAAALPSADLADLDLGALVADTRQADSEDRQVTNEVVRRELAALSDQAREPLVLKYLNGFTNQQVADALGISLSNVKVRVARAKDVLLNRLDKVLGG